MTAYVMRRLSRSVLVVFLALSFLFLLYVVFLGEPAELVTGGGSGEPTEAALRRADETYRFDDPILVQFGRYWRRTLSGDLGESYQSGRSVNDLVREAAPRSIRLAVWSIVVEIAAVVAVALASTVRRRSFVDRIVKVATVAAFAVPVFVLAFVVQYVLAIVPQEQGWPASFLPKASGRGDDSWLLFVIPTGNTWRYLILPSVTLASASAAMAARVMRGSMVEVLGADFVRTARAKGLGVHQAVFRHGLRTAMLPVATLIGIDVGTFIGAAVLTETAFGWDGLGSGLADSLARRDLPVLIGLSTILVLACAGANLLVDIVRAWLDPRLRLPTASVR